MSNMSNLLNMCIIHYSTLLAKRRNPTRMENMDINIKNLVEDCTSGSLTNQTAVTQKSNALSVDTSILATRDERVKLLKAGFTGREIERLYVIHNSLDIMGVDWQIDDAEVRA